LVAQLLFPGPTPHHKVVLHRLAVKFRGLAHAELENALSAPFFLKNSVLVE
jgi:hypothetical protein